MHLFHHDPEHNDDVIDGIVAKARELFPNTKAAKEGMVVPLGSQATRRLVKIANELKTA